MNMSMVLFNLVLWVAVGAMLKKFSNFLSYLILIEGACVSIGGMIICAQDSAFAYSLFIFLVMVACETALGLSLMVGIMRNSSSGIYSLYSQSA
uniref:NADH dehydrogenase subunit 4L n=1 Tax=Crassostrea talonata TaxID=1356040 RepID=A0A342KBB2_9BIVA|nr:NADH dehydrogenase subunit 4L [Crassostrea talonata]ANC95455.1 NADH dehydrogenase subunit 4L [Crassostrea talonata]ANC95467.1 NADH dehydrogenase subunit 4L [Crassostrea talonata]UOU85762.1 NADH dehydrogenase subunit 4L [Crassostrea talonata]